MLLSDRDKKQASLPWLVPRKALYCPFGRMPAFFNDKVLLAVRAYIYERERENSKIIEMTKNFSHSFRSVCNI